MRWMRWMLEILVIGFWGWHWCQRSDASTEPQNFLFLVLFVFFLHSSCRDLLFCFLLAHVKPRSSISPRFPMLRALYPLVIKRGNGESPINGGLVRWENHRSNGIEKGIFQQGTFDFRRSAVEFSSRAEALALAQEVGFFSDFPNRWRSLNRDLPG